LEAISVKETARYLFKKIKLVIYKYNQRLCLLDIRGICKFKELQVFPRKRIWKTRETEIQLVSLKIIFRGKSCGKRQLQDFVDAL
jgi:hypothetical protein